MKRQNLFIISILILALFLLYGPLYAAGTCITTEIRDEQTMQVMGYKFAWTSDSSGAVSSVGAIGTISGSVIGVNFVPGTGGNAPSNLYDVTIVDDAGADVLIGVGGDAPQSATSTTNYRTPLTSDGGYPVLLEKTLTPAITNAGDTKSGVIYLYVR